MRSRRRALRGLVGHRRHHPARQPAGCEERCGGAGHRRGGGGRRRGKGVQDLGGGGAFRRVAGQAVCDQGAQRLGEFGTVRDRVPRRGVRQDRAQCVEVARRARAAARSLFRGQAARLQTRETGAPVAVRGRRAGRAETGQARAVPGEEHGRGGQARMGDARGVCARERFGQGRAQSSYGGLGQRPPWTARATGSGSAGRYGEAYQGAADGGESSETGETQGPSRPRAAPASTRKRPGSAVSRGELISTVRSPSALRATNRRWGTGGVPGPAGSRRVIRWYGPIRRGVSTRGRSVCARSTCGSPGPV